MKLSNLKFGDKFRFIPGLIICVFTHAIEGKYFFTYISKINRLVHDSYETDLEIEPVGSVEQDKKLVWISSSERAPTTNDCDNTNCLYVFYNNLPIRATISRLDEYSVNGKILWAPINKPPVPPELEYKLLKAMWPKDHAKEAYNSSREHLGVIVGYHNNIFIIKDGSNLRYYSDTYILKL